MTIITLATLATIAAQKSRKSTADPMTPRQRKEYESLTDKERQVYDSYHTRYPHWAHSALMATAGIAENITSEMTSRHDFLDEADRKKYDRMKSLHPEWPDAKIYAFLTACYGRNIGPKAAPVENDRRAKEEQEYMSLSEEGRHLYDRFKASHPDLYHAKWFTYAEWFSKYDTSGFGDADTKTIMTETLNKTGEHLKTNFPEIFAQVKDTLVSIGNAIKRAVTVTWDSITNLFS